MNMELPQIKIAYLWRLFFLYYVHRLTCADGIFHLLISVFFLLILKEIALDKMIFKMWKIAKKRKLYFSVHRYNECGWLWENGKKTITNRENGINWVWITVTQKVYYSVVWQNKLSNNGVRLLNMTVLRCGKFKKTTSKKYSQKKCWKVSQRKNIFAIYFSTKFMRVCWKVKKTVRCWRKLAVNVGGVFSF